MMKRTFTGILFSLALTIGMMSVISLTAYANEDEGDYKLWVGDIQVTSDNAANITGSDPVQASYDAASNTLTLNNYTYEGPGTDNDDRSAAIRAGMTDDFTIDLIGDNTIRHIYEKDKYAPGAGLYVDNNVTVTGDGTLTVSDGDNYPSFDSHGIIASNGDIIIESDATVNVSCGFGSRNYGVSGNDLTVKGELNAVAGNARNKSYGVNINNGITVSEGGKLSTAASTGNKEGYGVYFNKTSPDMTIQGALTARGMGFAIAKTNGNTSVPILYTIRGKNAATESKNYDGSGATPIRVGEHTSEHAKYVWIARSVPVTGVSLNKTSTALEVGESETLTATLKPKDTAYPDLVWDSTGSDVATVSENGEVTAVAAGKATIIVTATNGTDDAGDDKTATCDVTVKTTDKVTAPAGRTLTYNGRSQTGVAAGTGYTLSGMTSATNAGTYQATATLDEGYVWDDETSEPKTISWKIEKAAVNVTAPAGRTFTYNGKAQTGVASGSDYTLSGTAKATNAGAYTAKASLKTNTNYTFKWTDGTTAAKTISWKINKAANTFRIGAKTATVKGSTKGRKGKLKKTKTLTVGKVIKFTNQGQGMKTYVRKSGNARITIAKTTGKVTVKKGLKKGTYKVKVQVRAAGNANYKPSVWKVVTFTVKVR